MSILTIIIIHNHCIISGTPLLNMVIWCLLRVHNDGEADVQHVQHGQDGLDHREKEVSAVARPGVDPHDHLHSGDGVGSQLSFSPGTKYRFLCL